MVEIGVIEEGTRKFLNHGRKSCAHGEMKENTHCYNGVVDDNLFLVQIIKLFLIVERAAWGVVCSHGADDSRKPGG